MNSALIPLLILLLAASLARGQSTSILFDGPPEQPRSTAYAVPQYDEAGFLFKAFGPIPDGSPNYHVIRNGGGNALSPENGSAYLQLALSGTLEFFRPDGKLFNLSAVDLAEYSTFFARPQAVTFNGFRLDGSTVSVTFTTDGIIDGTGPLADFQTFVFPAGFQQLQRVEIPSQPYSLDNLALTVIPEPSALILSLLGLLTVAAARTLLRKPCPEPPLNASVATVQ